MDLSKIDKKLRGGSYTNPMQFAADIRKIWANAILYNPKNNPIHDMALEIGDYFETIYKPVEENPFTDGGNEYLLEKVQKLEKRLQELKNDKEGQDWSEIADKPLSYEERLQLKKLIEGSLGFNQK